MYTIKIQTWKGTEGGPATKSPDDTHYIAGTGIITATYEKAENESITDLAMRILKERNSGECFNINHSEEAYSIIFLSFFDEKGEYQTRLIFNLARVYIMQNGKTVDSIII